MERSLAAILGALLVLGGCNQGGSGAGESGGSGTLGLTGSLAVAGHSPSHNAVEIPTSETTLPSGKKKTQEIYDDTVLGFNKFGNEIVRIQVEEPTFERPKNHVNSI